MYKSFEEKVGGAYTSVKVIKSCTWLLPDNFHTFYCNAVVYIYMQSVLHIANR